MRVNRGKNEFEERFKEVKVVVGLDGEIHQGHSNAASTERKTKRVIAEQPIIIGLAPTLQYQPLL